MLKDLIVIVFGGRDYNDREAVHRALEHIHRTRRIHTVITGGAPGADRIAAEWAISRGVKSIVIPADWKKHGKGAGPIRNEQMLALNPDAGIGFPGGRGTADMKARLVKAGKPVWEPISQGRPAEKQA